MAIGSMILFAVKGCLGALSFAKIIRYDIQDVATQQEVDDIRRQVRWEYAVFLTCFISCIYLCIVFTKGLGMPWPTVFCLIGIAFLIWFAASVQVIDCFLPSHKTEPQDPHICSPPNDDWQ